MSDATISNNAAQDRYELKEHGEVIGVAEYRITGNVMTLTHTEVAAHHGGKGYGSALAKYVLDDARRLRKQVVPACGFIAAYIDQHPEYADLVAPA